MVVVVGVGFGSIIRPPPPLPHLRHRAKLDGNTMQCMAGAVPSVAPTSRNAQAGEVAGERRHFLHLCTFLHLGTTWKHITLPFCYAMSLACLLAWSLRLESLALKGKPPATMLGRIRAALNREARRPA